MTRRDRSLERRAGTWPERTRILIYCEGKRTEVSYFDSLRTELRAGTIKIKIGSEHREPLGLVKAAIEHKRREASIDPLDAYDQVWCVFDVEAPKPHENLDAAIRLANKSGVQCAVSNPCFELWLLLHFRDPPGHLSNQDAQRMLEGYRCGYSRRRKRVDYASLRGKERDALDRAARLDRRYDNETDPQKQNPWTSVHKLVDILFTTAQSPVDTADSSGGGPDLLQRGRQ